MYVCTCACLLTVHLVVLGSAQGLALDSLPLSDMITLAVSVKYTLLDPSMLLESQMNISA